MGKLRLVSIYMYEKRNNIWVDARFNNEAVQGSLRSINVHFSLPKDDPRGVEDIEKLAAAKAEEYFKKILGLMNKIATSPQTNNTRQLKP